MPTYCQHPYTGFTPSILSILKRLFKLHTWLTPHSVLRNYLCVVVIWFLILLWCLLKQRVSGLYLEQRISELIQKSSLQGTLQCCNDNVKEWRILKHADEIRAKAIFKMNINSKKGGSASTSFEWPQISPSNFKEFLSSLGLTFQKIAKECRIYQRGILEGLHNKRNIICKNSHNFPSQSQPDLTAFIYCVNPESHYLYTELSLVIMFQLQLPSAELILQCRRRKTIINFKTILISTKRFPLRSIL